MTDLLQHAHQLMPILAMAFAVTFAIFRIAKRYTSKTQYALKTKWAWILIGINSLISLFLFWYLDACGFKMLPTLDKPILNSFFLTPISAALSSGIISLMPMKVKTRNGQTIIDIATWINEMIESEIDRLVTQAVTELAIQMEENGVTIEKLQQVGNHLVYQRFAAKTKERNAELAKLDDMVRTNNLPGLIGHLMIYCDPLWLVKQCVQKPFIDPSPIFQDQTKT